MTTFKLRRGDAQRWTEVNPVLSAGEPGVERDTGRLKIGDGTTRWNDLPYAAGGEGSGIPGPEGPPGPQGPAGADGVGGFTLGTAVQNPRDLTTMDFAQDPSKMALVNLSYELKLDGGNAEDPVYGIPVGANFLVDATVDILLETTQHAYDNPVPILSPVLAEDISGVQKQTWLGYDALPSNLFEWGPDVVGAGVISGDPTHANLRLIESEIAQGSGHIGTFYCINTLPDAVIIRSADQSDHTIGPGKYFEDRITVFPGNPQLSMFVRYEDPILQASTYVDLAALGPSLTFEPDRPNFYNGVIISSAAAYKALSRTDPDDPATASLSGSNFYLDTISPTILFIPEGKRYGAICDGTLLYNGIGFKWSIEGISSHGSIAIFVETPIG